MLSIIISIIIYFLINSVISISNNQINIDINYGENDTIILLYNLTTNYSYFITFRLFGDKQLKYGLFLSLNNNSKQNSIEIFEQYYTKEKFYLFIICFHFIIQINDLDIQCKDIRLLKKDQILQDFLPSYNPLFVPMMYALSVLMLLPVIIQHHRHKKVQLIKRHKQLKRLSVSIANDNQNPQHNLAKKMLSQFIENGHINYENISTEIELISIPTTKIILDNANENINSVFTLENLQPFIPKNDENDLEQQSYVNADDCIAHLLDNTPWNTPQIDEPFITSSSIHPVILDCATARKEQHMPTIVSFHDDDNDDDDRKPILKSNKYSTINLHRTNRVFIESDV